MRPLADTLNNAAEPMQTGTGNATNDDCPLGAIKALCIQLMRAHRDPASIALATDITEAYAQLSSSQRVEFMMMLKNDFAVDPAAIIQAAKDYESDPNFKNQQSLARVIEAPRQKLFRCINTASDGLQTLIRMRQDLLGFSLPIRNTLRAVEEDLKHLLQSWFNSGFLQLWQIDWKSPASLLEKLTEYEAVHQISNWDDLRRRLQADRRCFAFFHPSMKEEPLVFVEVALTKGIAGNILSLIDPESEVVDPTTADTAMFYSISSCQSGLLGISFGGLLIKQVVNELQKNLPSIQTFSTLSPVPGFCRWLGQQSPDEHESIASVIEMLQATMRSQQPIDSSLLDDHRDSLMVLLADYLMTAKIEGRPVDSVARFHLGNGAKLHAIHWMADESPNGLKNSLGMMVNYVYDLDQIQSNRTYFLQHQVIAAHPSIHALIRSKK